MQLPTSPEYRGILRCLRRKALLGISFFHFFFVFRVVTKICLLQVMELCESSLEPLIGKIKQRRAIEIAIQVASGMIYLHNRNITHRDLKPANILVGVYFYFISPPHLCSPHSSSLPSSLFPPSFPFRLSLPFPPPLPPFPYDMYSNRCTETHQN